MNENTTITPQYVSPLKRICMTIGELPTSYLETMSYYEMLVWFTKFLGENVIPAVNNNALAVQELQNLYTILKNYVDNYFDNLDVQEEINTKIDNLIEAGTFGEIVNYYLTPFEENLNNIVTNVENTANNVSQSFQMNRENSIKCKIIAHRGCNVIAPENSIPAFEYVGKLGGYAGCETDVRRTYDGVFIIMHDESVDRTTDGTGNVADLLYSTIQNLRIDTGNYIEDYTSSELVIPTLENYLKIMKKYGLMPVIEIKPEWDSTIIQELINEIRKNDMLYNCMLISYYQSVCTHIKNIDGNIMVGLLADELDEYNSTYCINNHVNILTKVNQLSNTVIKNFHNAGIKVGQFTDYNYYENIDIVMCEDITRFTTRDEFYEDLPITQWESYQMKMYGNAWNGRPCTLLRRGITTTEKDFPGYFKNTNNNTLVCFNAIPIASDKLFNYNIPTGYDMNVYRWDTPTLSGGTWNPGWITGDSTNGSNVNVTYLANGFIVLAFRKTDQTAVNYKDIEFLRKNAKIWFTNRT